MITKHQALTHRGEFWHMYLKRSDGAPARCRVNGKCKTWVRQPEAWQLPVKHGLNGYFYITQFSAHEWCIPELWDAEHVIFEGAKS